MAEDERSSAITLLARGCMERLHFLRERTSANLFRAYHSLGKRDHGFSLFNDGGASFGAEAQDLSGFALTAKLSVPPSAIEWKEIQFRLYALPLSRTL